MVIYGFRREKMVPVESVSDAETYLTIKPLSDRENAEIWEGEERLYALDAYDRWEVAFNG